MQVSTKKMSLNGKRVDLLGIITSVMALFLCNIVDLLASFLGVCVPIKLPYWLEGVWPWWIMHGGVHTQVFHIKLSPFYVSIDLLTKPAYIPIINTLCVSSRLVFAFSTLILMTSAILPGRWWAKTARSISYAGMIQSLIWFIILIPMVNNIVKSTYDFEVPIIGEELVYFSTGQQGMIFHFSTIVTSTFPLGFFLAISVTVFMITHTLSRHHRQTLNTQLNSHK